MDNYLLFLTLFFPRLTLVFYWLNGWIPPNAIPFWGDAVMCFFILRVLVLIYIYQNLGVHSGWFWAHVAMLILCYGGGGSAASSSRSKD